MIKQNPAVDHQDVALEVLEGDLVDQDLHETSLYPFVLKNNTKHVSHLAPIDDRGVAEGSSLPFTYLLNWVPTSVLGWAER